MIYITSPTIAGTRTAFPDSPPKTTLQHIFANAIKTITAIPTNKLRFQNATARAESDAGIKSAISTLDNVQSKKLLFVMAKIINKIVRKKNKPPIFLSYFFPIVNLILSSPILFFPYITL